MTTRAPKAAYDILGVSPSDDFETIRSAWRRLVKANHPDIVGGDPGAATRRLAEINDAYDALRRHNPKAEQIIRGMQEAARKAAAQKAASRRAAARAREQAEAERRARADARAAAEMEAARMRAAADARAATLRRAAERQRKDLLERDLRAAARDGRTMAALRAYATTPLTPEAPRAFERTA